MAETVSEGLHAGLAGDAYGGYDGVVAGNAITRAGCWRMPDESLSTRKKTAPEIAREVVALLRTLFAIENQAREASASERLEIRQKQSVPVLAELRQRLLVWKEQLLPQHPMADAGELHLESLGGAECFLLGWRGAHR